MDLFYKGAELILENKTLSILIIALCLLYYHFTSTFTFFKDRGIPFKTPTIFLGNIGARLFMKISFHEFNLKLYRDFDGQPFAGYFEGRRPALLIRDPDLIKTIFIKDFDHFVDRGRLTPNEPNYINRSVLNLKGAEWKSIRSILTPCFSSARLRAMAPYIEECISNVVKGIHTKIKDNPEVEMKTFTSRLTLDIIGTCAFGIDCSALQSAESNFAKVAGQFDSISVLKKFYVSFVVLFMSEAAKYLELSFWNLDALSELREILQAMKKIRRNDPSSRRNDFLQMLLDPINQEKKDMGKNPTYQQYLDDDTIDGQALTFLIAGFETTSIVLDFTVYLLALHPEVQTRLRKEVKEIAARYNGEINYDSITAMSYLEAVLLESMRLYPPFSMVDRICVKKYTIPGTNITLMPGDGVAISIIGIHMDSQYYPEPEKFKPERFSTEERGSRPSQVYLPFGTGLRNCIGLRFATFETKLALARLIMDFEVAPSRKTQVPIQFDKTGIFLKPEQGIWVKVSSLSPQ